MATQNLHFKVQGENLTTMIRDFWDSELLINTFDALNCLMGMQEDIAIKILMGEYTLVGNETDGITIAEDTSGYKPLYTMKGMYQNKVNRLKEIAKYAIYLQSIAPKNSNWSDSLIEYDENYEKRVQLEEKFQKLLEEITFLKPYITSSQSLQFVFFDEDEVERMKLIKDRTFNKSTLDKVRELDYNGYYNMSDSQVVKQEIFSGQRNGWISPKGEFFPCAFASHKYQIEGLLDLGVTTAKDEEELEASGWLKMSAGKFYFYR